MMVRLFGPCTDAVRRSVEDGSYSSSLMDLFRFLDEKQSKNKQTAKIS